MRVLPSIRKRIISILILGSLVWGLAVTAVVWGLVVREVDDLLDSGLQESAEVLYGLLSLNSAALPAQDGGSLPAPVHAERLVWQLVGPNQAVLLRSHRAPLKPFLPTGHTGLADAGPDWRVYSMTFATSGRTLFVAQRTQDRRNAQREVVTAASLSTLAVGGLFALWLRQRIRSELRPLRRLSRNVAAYDPLTASTRLPPVSRSELEPIHRAISDLGQRLARRVSNERAFTAHAAHALRTPLAGMDAQLAVALRECTPQLRPRLERTREAANRLSRVVSALLTLFRSGVDLHWQSVDLGQLLSRVPVDALEVSVSPLTRVQGDTDLLAAAFINLLDNAVRHGAKRVQISAISDADCQTLLIQDDGPGMSSERLREIQAALSAQEYEGHMGLGFMLADLVARAHGGEIQLQTKTSGFALIMRLGWQPTAIA